MKEVLIPETIETLFAQGEALLDGRKPALYDTHDRLKLTHCPKYRMDIGTVYYRGLEALELIMVGRLGLALGYGIDHKPYTGVVMTVRDEHGTVIHDVATDGRQSVWDAAAKVAGDKGTFGYRRIEEALLERTGMDQATFAKVYMNPLLLEMEHADINH